MWNRTPRRALRLAFFLSQLPWSLINEHSKRRQGPSGPWLKMYFLIQGYFFCSQPCFFRKDSTEKWMVQANEGINGQPLELGDAGIQFTNELASSLKLKNTHVFHPFFFPWIWTTSLYHLAPHRLVDCQETRRWVRVVPCELPWCGCSAEKFVIHTCCGWGRRFNECTDGAYVGWKKRMGSVIGRQGLGRSIGGKHFSESLSWKLMIHDQWILWVSWGKQSSEMSLKPRYL